MYSGVTDADIHAAQVEINALENRGDDLVHIAGWDPWQQLMQRTYPKEYKEFEKDLYASRDWLADRHPNMPHDVYARQAGEQKERDAKKLSEFMNKHTHLYLSENNLYLKPAS